MLIPKTKYTVIGYTALRCDNCKDEELKRILQTKVSGVIHRKYTCDACDFTKHAKGESGVFS